MSHPVTPGPREAHVPPTRSQCAPRAPRSYGAVFQILHMPYGIRNSESQNRESGNSEKQQIMVRSDAFEANPRKHWSECGPQISSLIQRFPLDDKDHGAVGCAP